MNRTSERGFTLLEAAIATALTCAVVLGLVATVAHALHANATIAERAALTDDALNVLSDLRAATAYDAGALAQMTGKTTNATIVRNGQSLAVVVAVGGSGPATPVIANVTVTDPNGESATISRQLYVEAPAPGSVIDEPSPAPSGAALP